MQFSGAIWRLPHPRWITPPWHSHCKSPLCGRHEEEECVYSSLSRSAKHVPFLFIPDEEPTSTNSASGHFGMGQCIRSWFIAAILSSRQDMCAILFRRAGSVEQKDALALFSQRQEGEATEDKTTAKQRQVALTLNHSTCLPEISKCRLLEQEKKEESKWLIRLHCFIPLCCKLRNISDLCSLIPTIPLKHDVQLRGARIDHPVNCKQSGGTVPKSQVSCHSLATKLHK